MSKLFSYGRIEKLKSRKQLSELFASKQAFYFFPVKVFYAKPACKLDNCVKTGVGVTTRHFKKAVDRNRIKRLFREAYRLHKLPLHQHLEEQDKQLIVFFLYTGKELPQKHLLQHKMPLLIRELIKRLNEQAS